MEVEHSTPSQSSSEEEDELHRSVKKFKVMELVAFCSLGNL